jgi:hypothetical protein
MRALINIDVPELGAGEAVYTAALGLRVARRIGRGVSEIGGLDVPLYLIEKPEGSRATPSGEGRRYARHWTPAHLDLVVEDVEAARDRAVAAGAVVERDVETVAFGRIALMADPFGHGFCLIEFAGRGYGEIA